MNNDTLLNPLSNWFIRLALIFFIETNYYESLAAMNFKSTLFYISAGFFLGGILLILGGFFIKSYLTRISGVILTVTTGYHFVINIQSAINENIAIFFLLGAISVFFLISGNTNLYRTTN